MIKLSVIWAAIFASFTSLAIAADLSKSKNEALDNLINQVVIATKNFEAAPIVAASHPRVWEVGGGKKNFLKLTESILRDMKAKGVVVHSVTLGEKRCQENYLGHDFCVIEKKATMEIDGVTLIQHSPLVAVSDEETRASWKLLDGAVERQHPGTIQKLLPWLPSNLVLPRVYTEQVR